MIRELKTFEVVCDRCKKVVTAQANREAGAIPKTWKYIEVHGCGMTGYTRSDLLCPERLEKHK